MTKGGGHMDPDDFDVALARKLRRPVTRERVITVDGVSRIESTTADPDGTVTKRCVQSDHADDGR